MSKSMFKSLVGLLFAASLLVGCSSGPSIITNSAPGFSLINYKTFGFFQPLSTDRGNVQSLESKQLIASATRELEMSGLRRADNNPDLLVNFVLSSRETLQTRPSSSVGVHHGRGRYGTWGGYSNLEPGEWYVGPEIALQVGRANFGIGVLRRVSGDEPGKNWRVTAGLGWGF